MVGDRQPLRRSEISAPAFVGREREVEALRLALSKPPAVVLVEAEPGAGKSRLVREFLASAGGHRHRMLVAVCPPFREALTLGPIVDAVRQARAAVAGLRLSPLAGSLRPLLPEWAADLPAAPEPLDDPRAARHRLFRALAELVGALQVTGLVVEDVHWADAVTLEFLTFLAAQQAREAAREPLSMVITYRPAELPAGSLLLELPSRLPDRTSQVRLALAPLDVADTAGMVSSMLRGERVSVAFAGFLHRRTGGLPLAVEESVRLLGDRADLIRRRGEWVRRSLADLQVSPTLRDSVLERVQRLSRPAQQLLQAAAVLAEPTDPQVLVAVAGQAGQRAALTEAVGSGLLREDDRSRLAFRHAFMAQVVYEALPGADRRRLHLLAGQALESLDPPPVVPLTRHFREAGAVEPWCRYAELAAARAVASGDRTTATVLLYELLASAELPSATRIRLARQLAANALVRREPVDELHHRVVGTLRKILDSVRLSPAEQAEIRSPLGRLLAQQGDFVAAYAELERAIPHLEQDSAEAARAMTYLGWPILSPWPAAVHREWLRRAARVDLTKLSVVDRIAITSDRATALLQLGEESGWQVAAEIPTGATEGEPKRLLIRSQINLGYAAILWGRYGVARERLADAAELVGSERYPRLSNKILAARAELAWLTGAWDELAEQLTAMLGTDDVEAMIRLTGLRLAGRRDAAAGERRKAEDQLQRALQEALRLGAVEDVLDPAAALARLWLADGRVDDAVRVTEEPIQPVTSKGIWFWATDIAPARVAALAAAGQLAAAADLVTAYANGLGDRDAPAPAAGLATCRAVLTEARGGPAAEAYARAARAWDRLPRPYEVLAAREAEAGCRLAAGQTEAGLALLSQVWQGLSDLGAQGDAGRVARRLREAGVEVRQPWRGGRRGYGSEPSPRELEVVRLVLAGKTNREIAETLGKSPRTVAGQLGSVMRKLGVSSRTELAVRAVEAGLVPDDG
ncbi:MAG: AAA family ATPase [Micromonosporaceae bacterium]|nr:AAA family ATPase [Micromonosporaceae bacterium]